MTTGAHPRARHPIYDARRLTGWGFGVVLSPWAIRLAALFTELLPPAVAAGVLPFPAAGSSASASVNSYGPRLISQVAGAVVQNLGGTVNLGPEAHQVLDLVDAYGGSERTQWESAVHVLEEQGARVPRPGRYPRPMQEVTGGPR